MDGSGRGDCNPDVSLIELTSLDSEGNEMERVAEEG